MSDVPSIATDAFVMDLLRTAREHGTREERERVCAFLRGFHRDASDGPYFADSIEAGVHDAGRTFPPLPPTEEETP